MREVSYNATDLDVLATSFLNLGPRTTIVASLLGEVPSLRGAK